MVGVAQLVRAAGCGPAGRGFKSRHSPHFFAYWQKNMKPEKASLHAPKVRFMARSAASYAARRAS